MAWCLLAGLAVFKAVPDLMASALDSGMPVEAALDGLSLGAVRLYLRSEIANPVDVHLITGIGARRYLLEQPEVRSTTTTNEASKSLSITRRFWTAVPRLCDGVGLLWLFAGAERDGCVLAAAVGQRLRGDPAPLARNHRRLL